MTTHTMKLRVIAMGIGTPNFEWRFEVFEKSVFGSKWDDRTSCFYGGWRDEIKDKVIDLKEQALKNANFIAEGEVSFEVEV